MIVIANRSSTTAKVSRNVRSATGRCVLITARTASAKAMSVAVGIAQPRRAPPPVVALTSTNRIAGTSMPPSAATTGKAARRGSRRSPATNSRFSSNPATKKKMASSPSLAHAPRDRFRCSASGPTCRSRNAAYESAPGELAHTRATTVASSISAPPTVSRRSSSATREASGQLPPREQRQPTR